MNQPATAKKPLRCARCRRREAVAAYRPFCSKRCANADLGLWLTGSYAISDTAQDTAEDNPAAALPDPDESA